MYILKYNYCFDKCNQNKPIKFDIETTENFSNVAQLKERLLFLTGRYHIIAQDLHVYEVCELSPEEVCERANNENVL